MGGGGPAIAGGLIDPISGGGEAEPAKVGGGGFDPMRIQPMGQGDTPLTVEEPKAEKALAIRKLSRLAPSARGTSKVMLALAGIPEIEAEGVTGQRTRKATA